MHPTRPIRALALGLLLAACGSGKPTWTAFEAGPLKLDFPCTPKRTEIGAKCTRRDGAEYALRTVHKELTAEEELAESREYIHAIPKGEVFVDTAFPLRWREVRQFNTLDFLMFYKDGQELTLSVQYPTTPPAQVDEFFARAKLK